jgi:hypothetical protein
MVTPIRKSGFAIIFSVWSYALLSFPAPAQTNLPSSATTNRTTTAVESGKMERIRTLCVNGRRRVCGRVLQIEPHGLVVDSGYTSLLRPQLGRSWVITSNVAADRPANLIEANTPGAVCVGLVFVTDIPKKPAPKPYDYVVLLAYPAGQYTYTTAGTVHRTVRRFSAILEKAVDLNLQAEDQAQTPAAKVK